MRTCIHYVICYTTTKINNPSSLFEYSYLVYLQACIEVKSKMTGYFDLCLQYPAQPEQFFYQ